MNNQLARVPPHERNQTNMQHRYIDLLSFLSYCKIILNSFHVPIQKRDALEFVTSNDCDWSI